MALYESGEMYLETIYLLSLRSPNVRAIDVSRHMGYSKPSVSRAIGLLKDEGYVEVDENGYLMLTGEGLKIAKKTYERHIMLSEFFISLGVDKDIAKEDACRIEHVISDETFEALKKHFLPDDE
ncbi:MAG TPA: metal-dependent transcriptional regulator [Clostridiaceae bacterium]|nr:metal-dependent transcriptional regulator [Clostridiaceae bacterium]HOA32496.1 metal-dependent transcriptional regulator [Clostridia bacterium]